MKTIEILWIEDNPYDIALIQHSMKSMKIPYTLHFAYDGIQALDFLHHKSAFITKPNPDLIMLDIDLPRKNGYEFLNEVKQDDNLKKLPIILFSSSADVEKVLQKYDLEKYYIPKPFDYEKFIDVIASIEDFCMKNINIYHEDKSDHYEKDSYH